MALTQKEQLIKLGTQLETVIGSQAEMKNSIRDLDKKFDDKFGEMERDNKEQFVRKEEFDPIKRLVYGGVSIVLVSVIGAIVALVISNGGVLVP